MCGQKQSIEAIHNEDFTTAVELFRLFDDSRINTLETQLAIKKFENFKIRFYLAGVVECIFDSYMLACLLKNKNLIDTLAYDGKTWNLRPNERYCFGANIITPFMAICDKFDSNDHDEKQILELFLHVGGYNLEDCDSFGRKIDSDVREYILSRTV